MQEFQVVEKTDGRTIADQLTRGGREIFPWVWWRKKEFVYLNLVGKLMFNDQWKERQPLVSNS